MLEDRLLNLAEITALERGHQLGAPTLAHAARALDARWRHHLRDEETALRLAFLCWLRHVEPAWETGLDDRVPSAASVLDEFGLDHLSGEARFVVGWLATRMPAALGGGHGGESARWEQAAEPLLELAAAAEPHSRLLASWRWFCGETSDQHAILAQRRALKAEIHARFGGRGALGAFLVRHLSRSIEQAARRPRLV